MRQESRSRGKLLAGFAVRLVCFVLVTSAVIAYGAFVLTPKYDYGICPMINLYRQPADTVDVLVIGTSIAYSSCNTNVLWRNYGIASYNLCGAEMPFWSSYYQLREALRLQRPRLIILDAKAAVYTKDYSARARTILSTYGILSPDNRIGAILACQETVQQAMEYLLAYPQVHTNYMAVTWDDFILPPTNVDRGVTWKGYIETDKVEAHVSPEIAKRVVSKDLVPRAEEYARKIFELAKEEGIPLVVVAFPYPDYANDQPYFLTLWDIAREYGFSGINYNDPRYSSIGLDYEKDFADWQHLNVRGSIKMAQRLGRDLVSDYHIPDHRGDPAYESYETCAEIWYGRLDGFVTKPE